MAFQQQHKRPQPVRPVSYATPDEHVDETTSLTLQHTSTQRTLDASEEWVLFSPTAPSVTQTHTTSTDRTPRTAGLSRLSDFGSLDTAARSDQNTEEVSDNGTEQATDADEEAELDSLDDGLHAFHEPSDYGSPRQMLHRSGDTVLPTHDGLGTFGGSSDAIQTQLWQFERDAQRRRHRRRASSVQRTLEALEEVEETSEETERFRRVERWRLEQSRALLEEIERETRRMRRLSRATSYRSQRAESVPNFSSGIGTPTIEAVSVPQPAPPPSAREENEGFWQRITRRVIRDLIGIDEELLSVILGETLPEEAHESPASSSHDITKDKALDTVESVPLEGETWQHRLLERVARELGILVHQLSEHPGAFTTYLKAIETPPYAGITSHASSSSAAAPNIPRRASSGNITAASPSGALFAPTLPQHNQSDPSLWGIEEEPQPEDILAQQSRSMDAAMLQQEREYWERELDINMVFQFLKNRFSSRPSSPEPAETNVPYVGSYSSPTRRPSAYSAASGRMSAQRAALIRQHHPLASKLEHNRKKDLSYRHHAHHNGVVPQNLMRSRLGVRTRSDSCASQSTKRSRKSGSSRNFWDMGGSVGSGHTGLGAWGEVGI